VHPNAALCEWQRNPARPDPKLERGSAPSKLDEEVNKWCAELLALSPTCLRILKASFVEEFSDLLGQGDQLRRYLTGPEFWAEEQQEGARAFLDKRPANFARFRRRRA